MTRKSLLSFAAALVAATSLSGVAEAANGVRLGFGGPLGTFVATPAGGGGGSYRAAKPYCPPKMAAKKQNTATPSVARVMSREEPRAEKSHKASAAQDNDSKVTKSVRKSHSAVETASSEAKADKDENVADTATETTAPLSGSQALANQDAQPVTAPVTTEPAKTEGDTAEGASTSETVVAAHEETKETETTITAPAKIAEKIDETKDVGCKKFIPAIGVTVSIGCGK